MWKNCCVSAKENIKQAMQILNESAKQIVLVVDAADKLLGVITDGDVRRAILSGRDLLDTAETIMTKKPITANINDNHHDIIMKMREKGLNQFPIVDDAGVMVDLVSLNELIYKSEKKNTVVLMVGGLGTRLRPLTDKCPKPLLKIGNKPILETILENFIEAGFRKFYFAVNYKANMIENYFGNGKKYGVKIRYLYERKRLGTAGALGLISEKMNEPILIMNGDVLTKIDFEKLLKCHKENDAWGTMAVREYTYQLPYGVIRFEKNEILEIDEKPVQDFFVNAGVYVLDPCAIEYVKKDTFLDMPDLFKEIMGKGHVTAAFPIREYWLDIGRMDDFVRAQCEYGERFK